MTNVFFDDVKDYNDLEIHDSWRKYVEESGRVRGGYAALHQRLRSR